MIADPQKAFFDALDRGLNSAVVQFRIGDRVVRIGKADGETASRFCIRVNHERFFSAVVCYGNLGLGESFMRGDFEVEQGTLADFLTLLLRSRIDEKIRGDARLMLRIAWIRLRNALRSREINIRSHYDTGNDLFEMFLDPTLTYSCGYARTPEDCLHTLQQQKLDRICRKLQLQKDERLLDIGCGFGGLLIHAALHYGVVGTGVTISPAQQQRAEAEIAARGLSGRVRIELREYRRIQGRYDKIVSVGMLEHVPRPEYRRYFQKIARSLEPGGLGLVHSIGCGTSVNEHDPFIQKYIFPNSNQPRLSEIAGCLEHCGLLVLDVENIVRHYALTVMGWLQRFQENRDRLNPKTYDEPFRRMWEYYFSCGIAAARASEAAVYQVLFHNDRAADFPLARI